MTLQNRTDNVTQLNPVSPTVFSGNVTLGRLMDKRAIAVTITEAGGITITGPDCPPVTLTFDEAEHLASLLRDSALIYRVSAGAGYTVVA